MKWQQLLLNTVLIALAGLYSCKMQTKEERFWDWFKRNESRYYLEEENREALVEELGQEIHKVNEDLTFELSPVHKDKTKYFSISADGVEKVFPAVIALTKQAPQLKNWHISAFRQRNPGSDMEINYGENLKIAYKDIFFAYALDSGKVWVELHIKGYQDTPEFKNATYILLDGLLGEYDMVKSIAGFEFHSLDPKEQPTLFKITELRTLVDSLKSKKASR